MSKAAENYPVVRAVFCGTDGSMGFMAGKSYVLRLIPKDRGLNAFVYPSENTTGMPTHCPYASFGAFVRNWDFGPESDQAAVLLSDGKKDAERLFNENKTLATKNASLLDELNLLRAKYSEISDSAKEEKELYFRDRDIMDKVSRDLGLRLEKMREQLQEALNGKTDAESTIKDLSSQVEEIQEVASKERQEREDALTGLRESQRVAQQLSFQSSSLAKSLEHLTALILEERRAFREREEG